MSDQKSFSLVDLGDLSKPATVLIERVSDGFGGIFKPTQIRRVAKAEAEAAKILAATDIEITDMRQRALQRVVYEEGKRQENIEQITWQAAEQLGDGAKPENLDDDWLANFFDKCRIVSDADMQSLWAKLLAGEATAPGKYSKRTVGFVSNLDKGDAGLFTLLCSFMWYFPDTHNLAPLVFNYRDDFYSNQNINYSRLQHLDDIGLISFATSQSVHLTGLPKNIAADYFSSRINLELPQDNDNRLNIGRVMFTHTGHELAPICGASRSDEFFQYTLDHWTAQNLNPTIAV